MHLNHSVWKRSKRQICTASMSFVWIFSIVLITIAQGVESFAWKSGSSCYVLEPPSILANRATRFHQKHFYCKRTNNFVNIQINIRNRSLNNPQSVQLLLSSNDSSSSSSPSSPSSEKDTNNQKEEEEEGTGSLLGSSLFFTEAAIGAGMLALPSETAEVGFVPSISSLVLCWVFTYVTSLLTLEATWTVLAQQPSTDLGALSSLHDSVGFLSISCHAFGL